VVWKPEGAGEYDGLMTLNDHRSCPFVGAGVKCGQKNEQREIKLIIVRNDLPKLSVLKRCGVIVPTSFDSFYVGSRVPFARLGRTCLPSCPLAPVW